jgi:methyl-accepting chemotaxis protein
VAQRTGAAVQVRDRAGHPVASSPGFTAQPGPPSGAAVVVCGQRIGEAVTRFTGAGLSAADRRLQAALLRAIAGAAGLAALLALVTGLVAARRITRPVAKLIAVTRAMTAGDRSARAGPVRAPAELRELAAAFDQMAARWTGRNRSAATSSRLSPMSCGPRSQCCRPGMKHCWTASPNPRRPS